MPTHNHTLVVDVLASPVSGKVGGSPSLGVRNSSSSGGHRSVSSASGIGTRTPRSTGTSRTTSTPSTSFAPSRISDVIGERNRLFHFNAGRKEPQPPKPKAKRKKVNMWTHDFVCLAKTGMMKPPSSLEVGELLRAGLGKKHLAFYETGDSTEVHEEHFLS